MEVVVVVFVEELAWLGRSPCWYSIKDFVLDQMAVQAIVEV